MSAFLLEGILGASAALPCGTRCRCMLIVTALGSMHGECLGNNGDPSPTVKTAEEGDAAAPSCSRLDRQGNGSTALNQRS